jgi:UDP-N-acetylglucosamine 2-epimerase (non-hydrolysing)
MQNIGEIRNRKAYEDYDLKKGRYIVATLHRGSLVDNIQRLGRCVQMLRRLSETMPVVLPVHPRTQSAIDWLKKGGAFAKGNIILTRPLGYVEFLSLLRYSRLAITDSGGVQEETTALGIPCITYRTTTERWVTIFQGTNKLCDKLDSDLLYVMAREELRNRDWKPESKSIPKWDGNASKRALNAIAANMKGFQ